MSNHLYDNHNEIEELKRLYKIDTTTDHQLKEIIYEIGNNEYYGGNKKSGAKILYALAELESAQCTKTYKNLAQDVINSFKK